MGKLEFHKDKNFFMDWLKMNKMSTGEIIVWHTLMATGNRVGQKSTFNLPTSTLMEQTSLSKPAAISARNKLMERGFIKFEKGTRHKAPIYHMVPIHKQIDLYPNFSTGENVTQNLTQELTPELTIHKDQRKKEKSSCSPREEIIINAYEENIGKLVPIIREKLLLWLETYNELIINQAIYETVKRGGKTFAYLERILKHWQHAGLITLEEIVQYELDKEDMKTKQTFSYQRKVEKEEVSIEAEFTLEDLNL